MHAQVVATNRAFTKAWCACKSSSVAGNRFCGRLRSMHRANVSHWNRGCMIEVDRYASLYEIEDKCHPSVSGNVNVIEVSQTPGNTPLLATPTKLSYKLTTKGASKKFLNCWTHFSWKCWLI